MIKEPAEISAYLASIVDSSDDAIISKDLNGTITTWNKAAERIFGYTAEEAIGKHISIIIPPDSLPEEEFIVAKVKQGERIDHFETVRRTKEGKPISLSVTISPIRNSVGEIIGASKVARDMSSLKEAARTRAHLGAIIESSDDAIISKNLNSVLTSWNKGAERIFGYTAEEAVGKHISFIIPPERLGEEDHIIQRLKKGERIDHFETQRRHKSGRLIPISVTISPIRDADGTIIGASKIARDISERLEAQVALAEATNKKEEFLANMSHELRTPLNAVIGIANLLSSSSNLDDRQRKLVRTLKASGDNLMDLINDLLDFSKLESGNVQLEKVEFNLCEIITKAVDISSIRAQEKKLSLCTNYSEGLPCHFLGDPLRLYQVLHNLLGNAVKFTEEGSITVNVGMRPSETIPHLVIEVKDTGIGIAADKLNAIFDKFSQADASFTRRFGGSGLGLTIARALVEKMGGTLDVESQLGIGTTFRASIPLPLGNQTHQTQGDEEALTGQEITHKKKNILLVEDYEANILIASIMLEQMGYDFDVASTGVEAIRKFDQGAYDVILMDVQMPELDGLEATRRIRQMETERNLVPTYIIAMTAHVRAEEEKSCLDAGMNEFISKPFDPKVLRDKIQPRVQAT